jgi:hypothetical protein
VYTTERSCEKDMCSADVILEMLVIFIGDQFIERMEELVLPLIMNKFRNMRRSFKITVNPEIKNWPQHYKDEYLAENEGLDKDYFEKAIQYGYGNYF